MKRFGFLMALTAFQKHAPGTSTCSFGETLLMLRTGISLEDDDGAQVLIFIGLLLLFAQGFRPKPVTPDRH